MLTIFSWVFTLVALYGAYLNSQSNVNGFYFWIASNVVFFIINAMIGQWAQSVLFFAYLLISINGLIQWSKR